MHNLLGGLWGGVGGWTDPCLNRPSCHFFTIKNYREYDYCHRKIGKIYAHAVTTFSGRWKCRLSLINRWPTGQQGDSPPQSPSIFPFPTGRWPQGSQIAPERKLSWHGSRITSKSPVSSGLHYHCISKLLDVKETFMGWSKNLTTILNIISLRDYIPSSKKLTYAVHKGF